MTDFVRINQPRVHKIEEIIEMIGKSARSQKADGRVLVSMVDNIRLACAKHLVAFPAETPAEDAPEPAEDATLDDARALPSALEIASHGIQTRLLAMDDATLAQVETFIKVRRAELAQEGTE